MYGLTDNIVAGPAGHTEAAPAGHVQAGGSGHFEAAPAGRTEPGPAGDVRPEGAGSVVPAGAGSTVPGGAGNTVPAGAGSVSPAPGGAVPIDTSAARSAPEPGGGGAVPDTANPGATVAAGASSGVAGGVPSVQAQNEGPAVILGGAVLGSLGASAAGGGVRADDSTAVAAGAPDRTLGAADVGVAGVAGVAAPAAAQGLRDDTLGGRSDADRQGASASAVATVVRTTILEESAVALARTEVDVVERGRLPADRDRIDPRRYETPRILFSKERPGARPAADVGADNASAKRIELGTETPPIAIPSPALPPAPIGEPSAPALRLGAPLVVRVG